MNSPLFGLFRRISPLIPAPYSFWKSGRNATLSNSDDELKSIPIPSRFVPRLVVIRMTPFAAWEPYSAAALYGSQAANGVILITTKRGTKRDGMGMDFSSSSLFDNVAFLPDFQNEYGAGINGLILRNKPNNGEFMIDSAGTPMLASGPGTGAAHSWGPPMRGQMVRWWDGQMRPFTPQPDNYRDLYQ